MPRRPKWDAPPLVVGQIGTEREPEKLNRKDGTPYWRVTAGIKAAGKDGQIRYREITGSGKSLAAARLDLQAKATALWNGTNSLGKTATVADILDVWLGSLTIHGPDKIQKGADGVRPQTFDSYKRHSEYAKELLGTVTATHLTVLQAENQILSKINRKSLDGHVRARLTKVVLMSAYDNALRLGLVESNPMVSVRLPSKGTPDPEAPSLEDFMLLREIIIARLAQPGHKPHRRVLDMCDLLAGTGLRIGEALALRWMDVDLTDGVGTINIRGTIVNRQEVVRQSYPKSETSKAVIALPSYLIDLLQELYELAGKPAPEKPVFASRTGRFLPPSAIRISLRRIQEDSKVKLP